LANNRLSFGWFRAERAQKAAKGAGAPLCALSYLGAGQTALLSVPLKAASVAQNRQSL
jgi:hypothetical protein